MADLTVGYVGTMAKHYVKKGVPFIRSLNVEPFKITQNDLKYIYTLYLYPEKFYKLGNQYINAPKNWISPKMMEKIGKIIAEESKKQDLLGKFNRFYLEN